MVFDKSELNNLSNESYLNTFIISGNYNIKTILQYISTSNLHLDPSSDIITINSLEGFDRKFDTIFISTSSTIFMNTFIDTFHSFVSKYKNFCNTIVLKENRGGSRVFDFQKNKTYSVGAQTQQIQSSVGVGDVFDIAYIYKKANSSIEDSLMFASWISAEYASTTHPNVFYESVDILTKENISALRSMNGVKLPWEKRENVSIYIAAPDFDYFDTIHIDKVEECLKYHNFKAVRPIKENGQLSSDATIEEKENTFHQDLKLLEKADIVIAVLLNKDPGTLIEVGWASSQGKKVLLYDPYNIATNCFLVCMPDLVTDDLDELIAHTFIYAHKLIT